MESNSEDVLALVKLRLQLTDATLDTLIDSYIQELGQRILHYCNAEVVPIGLKTTWASMTIDALRVDQGHREEIAETVGFGEKVTVGDTSVSSEKGPGVNNVSKKVIEDVVLNYRIDLNRYRRLRW